MKETEKLSGEEKKKLVLSVLFIFSGFFAAFLENLLLPVKAGETELQIGRAHV